MALSVEHRPGEKSAGARNGATDLSRWLLAGSLVAILDISFADTYWVVIRDATTISRVFQSIASGLLGKSAFQGGTSTVVLGAILHCTVAFGWSAIFLLATRRWRSFGRTLASRYGAVKTGLPFGVMVWLVMALVVTPLSHARPTPVNSAWFIISLLWHAVGVGFPMAVVFRGDRARG